MVIFHYHLFKNAGTSTDELLRRNFGSRWATLECPRNRRENAVAVHNFVGNNPTLLAISSHTALLPAPQLSGVTIFPIVFIRHPIDRLRSAYEFERRQNANTAGAHLAKTMAFPDYVRELLRRKQSGQARNFQTLRLAHNSVEGNGTEIEKARRALGELPFVGLVEAYDSSIRYLGELLAPYFPGFRAVPARRNTALLRYGCLAQRLEKVKATLGSPLYENLCSANEDDLILYEAVRRKFQMDSRDPNRMRSRPKHW